MAWETIHEPLPYVSRFPVPGGWIYATGGQIVFVPVEEHKISPELADRLSDEAYDEAYTDGWRAAGGKVVKVDHTEVIKLLREALDNINDGEMHYANRKIIRVITALEEIPQ